MLIEVVQHKARALQKARPFKGPYEQSCWERASNGKQFFCCLYTHTHNFLLISAHSLRRLHRQPYDLRTTTRQKKNFDNALQVNMCLLVNTQSQDKSIGEIYL